VELTEPGRLLVDRGRIIFDEATPNLTRPPISMMAIQQSWARSTVPYGTATARSWCWVGAAAPIIAT
jgi:hypothetical protein